MNKNNFKILVVVVSVFVFISAGVTFYLFKKNNINTGILFNATKVEIMSDDEMDSLGLYHLGVYEVVSRDQSGKITDYKLSKLKDEKSINVEFMTDEEKAAKNLSTYYKIQVLDRDKEGNAIAYKIIEKESDVLNRY